MKIYPSLLNYQKSQWEKAEFEVSVPTRFTDEVWEAIHRGRRNFNDPLFLAQIPLLTGMVVPAIGNNLHQWNLRQTRTIGLTDAATTILERTALRYWRDIRKKSYILFGGDSHLSELVCAGGYFDRPLLGHLHRDYPKRVPASPFFLTRVGGQPAQAIRGAWMLAATPAQIALIEKATQEDTRGQEARDKLYEQGALVDLLPDGIYMMMEGENGTWHCSRPEGGHSAIFCARTHPGSGIRL